MADENTNSTGGEQVSFEADPKLEATAGDTGPAAINFQADRVRYLVNRADSTGGMPRDAVAQTLGRPADFAVVSDGVLVLDANNRGQPFVVLAPDAPITRDVSNVALELTRTMQPSAHPGQPSAAGVQ